MHKKRDLEEHHNHKTMIGQTTHNTITHALRFLLTLHTHAQHYQSKIFIKWQIRTAQEGKHPTTITLKATGEVSED